MFTLISFGLHMEFKSMRPYDYFWLKLGLHPDICVETVIILLYAKIFRQHPRLELWPVANEVLIVNFLSNFVYVTYYILQFQ